MRVVLTGATGWLGQAALEMLESAFGHGIESRVCPFASRARNLRLRSGSQIDVRPLPELDRLPRAPTLLLHFAYLTKDRTFDLSVQEFDRLNGQIRSTVGEAIERIGVSHILLPSSGAVYGMPTTPDRSLCDDPVGNPYGTQKIRDEQFFARKAREHSARILIARIFNLGGPFINKYDGYALSSIIHEAMSGRPIALRATRRVLRSYTSVRDLLDVSIGWLLTSDKSEAFTFDTHGDPIVEVGELAELVKHVLGRPDIRIERPPLQPLPDDRYLGDGRRFAALAAEQGVPLADLTAQIRQTADYMASASAA